MREMPNLKNPPSPHSEFFIPAAKQGYPQYKYTEIPQDKAPPNPLL